MVANAIREQIPNSYSVHVSGDFCRFNIGDDRLVTGVRLSYPMPAIALVNIEQYDDEMERHVECTVKPFQFNLDGRQPESTISFVKKNKSRVMRPTIVPEERDEQSETVEQVASEYVGQVVMAASKASDEAVSSDETVSSDDSEPSEMDETPIRCKYRRYKGLVAMKTRRRKGAPRP